MSRRNRFPSTILAAALLVVVLPLSAAQIRNADIDAPRVDLLLSDSLTREQMVDLYRDLQAAGFEPPACEPGEERFTDVPATSPFCPWIEELARRDITGGCSTSKYCPGQPVSRSQMAAFVVRAIEAGPAFRVIETNHSTSTLLPLNGNFGDLEHDLDGTWLGNDDSALLALTGPEMVDGRPYGLQAIEVCINAVLGDGRLSRFEVWSQESGGPIALASNVAGEGCHALEVGDADMGYTVHFVGGADSVRVSSVRATWRLLEAIP